VFLEIYKSYFYNENSSCIFRNLPLIFFHSENLNCVLLKHNISDFAVKMRVKDFNKYADVLYEPQYFVMHSHKILYVKHCWSNEGIKKHQASK